MLMPGALNSFLLLCFSPLCLISSFSSLPTHPLSLSCGYRPFYRPFFSIHHICLCSSPLYRLSPSFSINSVWHPIYCTVFLATLVPFFLLRGVTSVKVPFVCCSLHLLVYPSLWCQAWEVSLQLRSPWLLAWCWKQPHATCFYPTTGAGMQPYTRLRRVRGWIHTAERWEQAVKLRARKMGGGVVLLRLWERERMPKQPCLLQPNVGFLKIRLRQCCWLLNNTSKQSFVA